MIWLGGNWVGNGLVGTEAAHRINRMPVMSGSILVGIITRSNLMHAMVSMARVAPDLIKSKEDAGVRDQLLEEMNRE